MDEEDVKQTLAVGGDESQAMDDLWCWVCESGGCAPKVKLSDTCARTIVTSADVLDTPDDGGDTILSIPISCLMYPEVAVDQQQYGAALSALSSEDGVEDRTILVFFLAIERERGASSRWAPYVNSLPAEVPSPLGWSDAELRHLAGTRLEGAVKLEREALRQQTEICVPLLLARLQKQLDILDASSGVPAAHRERAAHQERAAAADILAVAERALTPERVAWSRSCVWSRAFSLFIHGTRTTALVPLGDMLDHSPEARTEWRTDDAAGTFSIISHQYLPKGSAVHNNYGAKSNEQLLLGYGFVLDPNPADTFHVQLTANKSSGGGGSDEARERERLLRRRGLCSNFFLRLDDPLPAALLDAARIYLLSPAAAYMCNSVGEGVWDPRDGIEASGDLCTSFRVLQGLTRLLTADFERLRSGLDSVSDSSSSGGSVRSSVLRMTTVYRNSQLNITAAALEVLRERSRHLLSKLEIAEQGRVATSNEIFSFSSRNATVTKENEDFELAYDTWETEIGVQKLAAEELSLSKSSDVLGAGVGGLRVTSPVPEGGVLGSAPMEALLTADDEILRNSFNLTNDNSEKAALAATLLMHAEPCTDDRWGPFARWLLSAPTTAAAFDKDVLDIIESTPLGQEAESTRQGYDDEIAALTTGTGVLINWKTKPDLSDSYARARAVVERNAFRLPCHRQTSQPSAAGRLALAPFVGSLPRKLDAVAGNFSWSYRPEGVGSRKSGWCLELRAACWLRPGSLLITPLDGCDEEIRLLEVGSGAASSPPVSPPLLLPNDGKTTLPSVGVSSVSAIGESASISTTSNPWHAVEMLLEPADEDNELRQLKKDLLRDAGLGEAHYLTLPPSPERLCLALAVCGAESASAIEVIRAALSEKSCVHSSTTPSAVGDGRDACGPTAGNTERAHVPGHTEGGGSSEPSLSFPKAMTQERHGDHFKSDVEPVGDVSPAIGTSFTLKVMSSNAGPLKRARRTAITLLRRMLGVLPKGVDSDTLWEHARDEVKRGNKQRACAFVYLAQHRATVEIWLEALTPAVDSSTLRGGKIRKRQREGENGVKDKTC